MSRFPLALHCRQSWTSPLPIVLLELHTGGWPGGFSAIEHTVQSVASAHDDPKPWCYAWGLHKASGVGDGGDAQVAPGSIP